MRCREILWRLRCLWARPDDDTVHVKGTTVLRWLKHGDPLPHGWRPTPGQHRHHLRYSVLIERIPKDEL